MKSKVTKKAVKDNYNRIIGIGYCNAQHLLNYQQPFAYSSGQNGWSCDYFDIDGICISTGYSRLNNQNTAYEYETLDKYEKQAQTIRNDYTITFEERKELINALLMEFVNGCIK